MGFPQAIAAAQRKAMKNDLVDIYDALEAFRSRLEDVQAHHVGMPYPAFSTMRENVQTAHDAIAGAYHLARGLK